MKDEKEDSIDKLFAGGLRAPGDEESYREEDWSKLEDMLDGKRPKGVVRSIIYLISAMAAMLLLVIGWLLFAPANKPDEQPQLVKKVPQTKKDTGTYGSPLQRLADHKNTLSGSDRTDGSETGSTRKSNSFFTLSAGQGDRTATGINMPSQSIALSQKVDTVTEFGQPTLAAKQEPKKDTVTEVNAQKIAAVKRQRDTVTELASNTTQNKPLVTVTDDIKPKKLKVSSTGFRPTLSLGIMASPDINSVKTFSNNKVGTNAGVVLSLALSRKWSISTGAIYADKPYNADFASYRSTGYPFKETPTSVTASCMVLDIPLNIGYQLYSKNGNKLTLGSGLSSYFMLRENYTFNHDQGNGYTSEDPWRYDLKNQNKHIFGILNLNATYQREVSSKLDIGVQPYFKLPLTGVGYGQVNLKSAGVAVSVMYNFKTGTKPK